MEKVSSKITYKDFDIIGGGYNPRQVDSFLDEINEDVCNLENELEQTKKENSHLLVEVKTLKEKIEDLNVIITELKANSQTKNTVFQGNTNVDILKRLSNVENMVSELLTKLNNNKS